MILIIRIEKCALNRAGLVFAREEMIHREDMEMLIFKYMGTTLALSLTLQAGFYIYCLETLAR